MSRREAQSFGPWILAALLAAGALQLANALFATLDGTDIPYHIEWLKQFQSLVAQGVLFPKWIPAGYHGLGSAVFYFYPPLTYYIGSAIGIVSGADARTVFGIVAALASVASWFAAYRLFRFLGSSKNGSTIAALLYAFAPFRVAELFSRASLSSHLAYVILPLVALGIARILSTRTRFDIRNVALLSVSIALLLLTSLPATSLAACFAVVLVLAFAKRIGPTALAQLALAAAMAGALTCFYWLPAATHTQYIQSAAYWKDPGFYITTLAHGSVTVEVLHALLVLGGVLAVLWQPLRARRPMTILERMLVVALAVYLVLEIPPIAQPLWQHVPMLQIIQVPWRLHIVLLLGVAAIVSTRPLADLLPRVWIPIWIVAAIGQSALVLTNFHLYTHWQAPDAYPPEYLPPHASEEIVHRAIFTPDQLRYAAIDRASLGDSVVLTDRSATRITYAVHLQSSSTAHLRQLYWPDWKADVNGRPTRVDEDAQGFAALTLPAGTYSVHLSLVPTPSEIVARWISFAAWLVVLGFVVLGRRSSLRSRRYARFLHATRVRNPASELTQEAEHAE